MAGRPRHRPRLRQARRHLLARRLRLGHPDLRHHPDLPPPPPPPPPPVGQPAGVPVIGDAKVDPLPPLLPKKVQPVIVKVDGNGNVTSSVGARTLSSASAPKSINCGVSGFDCYGEVAPGAELTLTAKPAAGYAFKKWTGSCAGSDATCDVVASNAKTVTAVFSAKGTGAAVGASLRAPRLKVKWRASIGAGTLVVQGSTTAPARTRIDMRRPGGGPLATLQVPVGGGSFRQVLPLRQGALSGGAKVFPGGFVVALTGRAGKLKLPLQVQTIAIPAPAEGVVRQASKSTIGGGQCDVEVAGPHARGLGDLPLRDAAPADEEADGGLVQAGRLASRADLEEQ